MHTDASDPVKWCLELLYTHNNINWLRKRPIYTPSGGRYLRRSNIHRLSINFLHLNVKAEHLIS